MGKFVSNPVVSLRGLRENVTAKTANYTVTSGESGTIFTNQGATGAVYFTLPAKSAGLYYYFANFEAQSVFVVSDAVNTLITLNDVTADSTSLQTANLLAGGGWFVFSDGTNWIALPLVHDTQTVTVA